MKRKVTVFFVIGMLFFSFVVFSPGGMRASGPPIWLWVRAYGNKLDDKSQNIIVMNGGGYVMFGQTQTLKNATDFFLSRIDEKGKILWAKKYVKRNTETAVNYGDLKSTSDGGLIFASLTKSFSYVNNVVVIKLDKYGNIEWQKVFTTPKVSVGVWDIIETSHSGYLIGGSTEEEKGRHGIFLMNLHKDGSLEWSKVYSVYNKFDAGAYLLEDDEGNFVASGRRYDPNAQPLMLKVDKNGNFIWEKLVNLGYQDDGGDKVIESYNNDGYIVSGWTYSLGPGAENLLLYKVDKSGELQWVKLYGGNKEDGGTSVSKTENGYVLDMQTNSFREGYDIVYFEIDKKGKILWERRFAGSKDKSWEDRPGNISQTQDSGFIFDTFMDSFGNGDYDVIVVKTDAEGLIKGCPYIKDVKIDVNDYTRVAKIVSSQPNVNNFKWKVKDADFVVEPIELNSNTIYRPIPATPVLLSPLDGTVVDSLVPILSWRESINASQIEIQISDRADFKNILFTQDIEETSITVPKNVLQSGKTYYWRVRGINNFYKGDWSNVSSFKVHQKPLVITLQSDNPMMTVNGEQQEIDLERGTKPVIIPKWSRTVVPIRAIVEALGGSIEWDPTERKVTINFKDAVIELWIEKPQARVNGEMKWIDEGNHDVKPIIINDRTMLPLRFVAENLGCEVDWDSVTKTITVVYQP